MVPTPRAAGLVGAATTRFTQSITSRIARLIALAWIAAASPAGADERFELAPFWGFTTLDTRATREPGGGALQFDERFEQGLQLGARFGVRLAERVTVEAEYRYSPNGKFVVGIGDRVLGPSGLEVPIDVGSHAVTGGVLYDLARWERWRPFVGATVGFEDFRTRDGGMTLRTAIGGGVRRSWRHGLGVRADVRYVLWPSFYLTAELESALEIDAGLTLGF